MLLNLIIVERFLNSTNDLKVDIFQARTLLEKYHKHCLDNFSDISSKQISSIEHFLSTNYD